MTPEINGPWTGMYIPGGPFTILDAEGYTILKQRSGMLPNAETQRLLVAVPDLVRVLTNLMLRVDNTPIEDGSNLDTAEAHALLERLGL